MAYDVQCSAHFFPDLFGFRSVTWQAPKSLPKKMVKYNASWKHFPQSIYEILYIHTPKPEKKWYCVWMTCNCVHNAKVYCSLLQLFINRSSNVTNVTKIRMKGHQTIKEHAKKSLQIVTSHFQICTILSSLSIDHLIPRHIRPDRFWSPSAWVGTATRARPSGC